MKFVDQVKIHIRSGRGGDGCSSFRREKFIPRGGPNGGDGGDGGAVYFKGTRGRTTLLDFQFRQHHRAGDGGHGKGKDMHGATGEPLVLAVPLGTIVRDAETGETLLEVLGEAPVLALAGGRGGRGNTRFKSPTNRAPRQCEPGQPGQERWVVLELKLMADVGLVGFPNAGKSTLISRISRARPKIADYPFTTLVPHLGVVQTESFESFVVADIPGIIAGAHEGAGLGQRFLRHIERTAILLLLLDGSGLGEREPWQEYEVLLEEMRLYAPALVAKPRAVALTKADLFGERREQEALRARLEAAGERVLVISAVTGEGIAGLIRLLGAEVSRVRETEAALTPDARISPSIAGTSAPPAPPAASDT
ncbi:MAG: GTPase ObgE [Candidatus Lambdaproteobacteria bacterium]|nr:GTPase ObgE [Candidatus Lambdaproteobacteria bacterium]